jgi:hypothetical protein
MAAVELACSSSETGVLGNGQFRYICQSGQDMACDGAGSSDVDLPGAIAVGATFQIGYTPKSSGGTIQGATGYEIVPASTRLAAATGNTIGALREGYVALLARHVGNADVDDFVHLRFATARTLVAQPTSLVIAAGSDSSVGLRALDVLGAPLAGSLGCQWQVTAGAPSVTVSGVPIGGSATVSVAADATITTATVHALCGAASIDIPVTVTGGSPDAGIPVRDGGPPDAGSPGADAAAPLDDGAAPGADGGTLG